MAEAGAVDTLLNRFDGYSRQPAVRQFALLLGLAAAVAVAMGVVQWAMAPAYKPLYGSMAPEDTSEVIAALEAAGIDYNLERRSGMIAVPAGDLQRARLALASEGFPRGEGIGFESLYREQEIGLSSFMEQARFHRALEAELSRTIAAMETVRAARVHLAMSKQSAFLRAREAPAASVMVYLYPGRILTERQLAGIVHLVASSVPNLEAEQVSVVDQQGRLLSQQGVDAEIGFTQEQFRFTRQIEDDYRERIIALIEPILGAGSVRAQVTADVDFTRVERTSEVYAPDTRIRSEQVAEESTSAARPGGVPGTLSNQPPIDAAVTPVPPGGATVDETDAQAAPLRSSRRTTVNYEIDKTISHIRETPGSLRKLSIAVVLDYIEVTADDGEVRREPLPQERVDEITALVREAVGFSGDRGDTVSVVSASLTEVPPPPEVELETSLLDAEWIWPLARGLAGLAVLLALIFAVLRPVVKFAVVPGPAALPAGAPAARAALDAPGEGLDEDQITLSTQQAALPPRAEPPPPPPPPRESPYQKQVVGARNLVSSEPERAASILREWISDDG